MRPRRRRAVSPWRVVAAASGPVLALAIVAIGGAHLGFGPLADIPGLHARFAAGGNIAFVGTSVPGNPTGDEAVADGLAGGGYVEEEGPADGPAAPETKVVRNLDDFFDPQYLRVDPGTTVEFRNDGRNPHTVTADDGSYDSGILQNGDVFEQTYTAPGVYPFNCKLHGAPGGIGMSGIVVVGDVEVPNPGGEGGVGPGREPVPTEAGKTIHVPADQPTTGHRCRAARRRDLGQVDRRLPGRGDVESHRRDLSAGCGSAARPRPRPARAGAVARATRSRRRSGRRRRSP